MADYYMSKSTDRTYMADYYMSNFTDRMYMADYYMRKFTERTWPTIIWVISLIERTWPAIIWVSSLFERTWLHICVTPCDSVSHISKNWRELQAVVMFWTCSKISGRSWLITGKYAIMWCERLDSKGSDFSNWHDPLRLPVVSYRHRSDTSHDKNRVMRGLLKSTVLMYMTHCYIILVRTVRSPNLFRVLSQIDSKQILVFILDKFALSQIDSEQILVFVLDKFTKKKNSVPL